MVCNILRVQAMWGVSAAEATFEELRKALWRSPHENCRLCDVAGVRPQRSGQLCRSGKDFKAGPRCQVHVVEFAPLISGNVALPIFKHRSLFLGEFADVGWGTGLSPPPFFSANSTRIGWSLENLIMLPRIVLLLLCFLLLVQSITNSLTHSYTHSYPL